MVKFRYWIAAIVIVNIVVLLSYSPVSYGETSVKNPLEWLGQLEDQVVGHCGEGGLLERLNNLEQVMTGRVFAGTVVERLDRLNTLLLVNQPDNVCMLYKIQALEWVLSKEGYSGPIQSRLEQIENLLFNTVYSGPITKRLERLVNQVFPAGAIKGKWVTVSEGTVVKVRMINELNSSQSKPGTSFQFEVIEPVFSNNFLVFPAGVTGSGILAEVSRPENWGRDAKLRLDFAKIRALDGTPIDLYYGSKAQKMDRSRQFAVGASAAGMLAFGPGGILFGLAVRGRETTIPAGTEFYLQVKEPLRIFTIEK
jgi:hypothetical protein